MDYRSVFNNSWKLFFYLALSFLLALLGTVTALNGPAQSSEFYFLSGLAGIFITNICILSLAHRSQSRFANNVLEQMEVHKEILSLLTQSPETQAGTLLEYEKEGKPVLEMLQSLNDNFGFDEWLDSYERYLGAVYADILVEVSTATMYNHSSVIDRRNGIESLPSWKFFEERRQEKAAVRSEENQTS